MIKSATHFGDGQYLQYLSILYLFAIEVVLYVDVLRPSVHETVLAECDASLMVLEDHRGLRLLENHRFKKLSLDDG